MPEKVINMESDSSEVPESHIFVSCRRITFLKITLFKTKLKQKQAKKFFELDF